MSGMAGYISLMAGYISDGWTTGGISDGWPCGAAGRGDAERPNGDGYGGSFMTSDGCD